MSERRRIPIILFIYYTYKIHLTIEIIKNKMNNQTNKSQ